MMRNVSTKNVGYGLAVVSNGSGLRGDSVESELPPFAYDRNAKATFQRVLAGGTMCITVGASPYREYERINLMPSLS